MLTLYVYVEIVTLQFFQMSIHCNAYWLLLEQVGNEGNGLHLDPHPRFVEGDGLFRKHGSDISDGAGLLMGNNSPFKNIPVLGWLL